MATRRLVTWCCCPPGWTSRSATRAIALVHDPVTSAALPALKLTGLRWAGNLSTSNPAVSPLFGSLEGLPPTTVYVCSLDAAGPDVLRLRARAIAENADITFVLRAGEFHVWPIGAPLPDSGTSNNDFTRNLQRWIAEERLALAGERPSAVCKVTGLPTS